MKKLLSQFVVLIYLISATFAALPFETVKADAVHQLIMFSDYKDFTYVCDIACSGSYLYVLDSVDNKQVIHQFDLNGNFIRKIAPGTYNTNDRIIRGDYLGNLYFIGQEWDEKYSYRYYFMQYNSMGQRVKKTELQITERYSKTAHSGNFDVDNRGNIYLLQNVRSLSQPEIIIFNPDGTEKQYMFPELYASEIFVDNPFQTEIYLLGTGSKVWKNKAGGSVFELETEFTTGSKYIYYNNPFYLDKSTGHRFIRHNNDTITEYDAKYNKLDDYYIDTRYRISTDAGGNIYAVLVGEPKLTGNIFFINTITVPNPTPVQTPKPTTTPVITPNQTSTNTPKPSTAPIKNPTASDYSLSYWQKRNIKKAVDDFMVESYFLDAVNLRNEIGKERYEKLVPVLITWMLTEEYFTSQKNYLFEKSKSNLPMSTTNATLKLYITTKNGDKKLFTFLYSNTNYTVKADHKKFQYGSFGTLICKVPSGNNTSTDYMSIISFNKDKFFTAAFKEFDNAIDDIYKEISGSYFDSMVEELVGKTLYDLCSDVMKPSEIATKTFEWLEKKASEAEDKITPPKVNSPKTSSETLRESLATMPDPTLETSILSGGLGRPSGMSDVEYNGYLQDTIDSSLVLMHSFRDLNEVSAGLFNLMPDLDKTYALAYQSLKPSELHLMNSLNGILFDGVALADSSLPELVVDIVDNAMLIDKAKVSSIATTGIEPSSIIWVTLENEMGDVEPNGKYTIRIRQKTMSNKDIVIAYYDEFRRDYIPQAVKVGSDGYINLEMIHRPTSLYLTQAPIVKTQPSATSIITPTPSDQGNSQQGSSNGNQANKNGWQKGSDNKWYFYNNDTIAKGWLKDKNTWYYLDKTTGIMKTGWLKEGSSWYYLKPSGAMATGWQKIGSNWYYMSGSGKMQTGWLKSGNSWYYLKSSGAMATGWQQIGGTWYWFNSSGAMVTGTQTIGGKTYRFSNSGAWIS